MRRTRALMLTLTLATLSAGACTQAPDAQESPQQADGAFVAGQPLETTPNVRVYGSFHFAESCSYDPVRDLYIAPSVGNRGPDFENDGYVSLINPDGTVHTPKWIGETRDGLTLNDPLGSDVANGRFYVVDGNVVRWFDLGSGAPVGSEVIEDGVRFNDLEVADDGTIYMSQTGAEDGSIPERVFRMTPDGQSSIFIDGEPLSRPNGIAFDPDGNIVVVNIGSADVLTFSSDGELLLTEQSIDPGNDGIVVLEDGTKYVSSVRQGTLARIRPGEAAEMIASGIPSPASICYDPTRERIIAPMNSWFALAFVELS